MLLRCCDIFSLQYLSFCPIDTRIVSVFFSRSRQTFVHISLSKQKVQKIKATSCWNKLATSIIVAVFVMGIKHRNTNFHNISTWFLSIRCRCYTLWRTRQSTRQKDLMWTCIQQIPVNLLEKSTSVPSYNFSFSVCVPFLTFSLFLMVFFRHLDLSFSRLFSLSLIRCLHFILFLSHQLSQLSSTELKHWIIELAHTHNLISPNFLVGILKLIIHPTSIQLYTLENKVVGYVHLCSRSRLHMKFMGASIAQIKI